MAPSPPKTPPRLGGSPPPWAAPALRSRQALAEFDAALQVALEEASGSLHRLVGRAGFLVGRRLRTPTRRPGPAPAGAGRHPRLGALLPADYDALVRAALEARQTGEIGRGAACRPVLRGRPPRRIFGLPNPGRCRAGQAAGKGLPPEACP